MDDQTYRKILLSASVQEMLQDGGIQPPLRPAAVYGQSSQTGTEPTKSGCRGYDTSSRFTGVESTPESSPRSSTKEKDSECSNETSPFAGGVEGGIEYQTMVWWHAGMVMVAETISIGILSLPMAMATLGIIPGLILLVGFGAMASYSGYVIGQFKIAHPQIHSWSDAGEVIFGWIGREAFGIGQLLFLVFIMGSHILTFAAMMNTLTEHGRCTTIFMLVGTIVSFVFTLPRTLKNLSYYSAASFTSIIAAVLATMIAVSMTKPGRHFDSHSDQWIYDVRLWPHPGLDFHTAFLATSNMVFAYSGHVAFFMFASELKNPREFPKALAFLQISDISMYVVTAVVIYYYTGDHVASPALDSASPIFRKIAYGLGIPTIVIGGVVNGHLSVKYVYVRLLRNQKNDVMHQRSVRSIGIWVFICAMVWIFAWMIAEVIPVFNYMLGISGALFASWFTLGLSGIFWFHLNFQRGHRWWHIVPTKRLTWGRLFLCLVNSIGIICSSVVCVAGLYASGASMQTKSHQKAPFSCAR